MGGDARYSLEQARTLAGQLVAEIEPDCERIAIAGSIRRAAPIVGDIELLVIPRVITDLLGQPAETPLFHRLAALQTAARLLPGRAQGNKYRQYRIPRKGPPMPVDLFLASRETWGVLFAIRTGPARFSRACVTTIERGGLLESGHIVRDGRVWRDGVPLQTPEEIDFLALCGGWIDPTDRAAALPDVHAARVAAGHTSQTAAQSMRRHTSEIRQRILEALAASHGLTCEELERQLAAKHQTVSARLVELVRSGDVQINGTRQTSSGRPARVYVRAKGG